MSETQQIMAIIIGGFTIAGLALGAVRWIINNEFRDKLSKVVREVVSDEVADIKHETTSNGGQSMNDFIKLQIFPLLKEMREDQLEIKGSVSELYGWKEEHIRNHP